MQKKDLKLTDEDHSYLNKITHIPSREECIKARYALFELLKKNQLGDLTDSGFSKNIKGKPILKYYPNYHISLSHTCGLGFAVIADFPVGLDSEVDRSISTESLSAAFHSEELVSLSENRENCLDLFSAKEAYLKYTGEGLMRDPARFKLADELKKEGLACVKFNLNILNIDQSILVNIVCPRSSEDQIRSQVADLE